LRIPASRSSTFWRLDDLDDRPDVARDPGEIGYGLALVARRVARYDAMAGPSRRGSVPDC